MSIEDQVRALVRDELRRLGVAVRTYRSDQELPPGIKSREHFASECRRLRVGRRDGKVWSVDADAWHAARSKARRPTRPSHAPSEGHPSDVERADALLDRSAGLRLVRSK